MKILFVIFLFSLAIFAKESFTISNAFYGEDIDKVNYKDAKTAMDMWIKELAKNMDAKSELTFYTDFDKVKQARAKGKVDMLLLSPISYLKNLHYCKTHFDQGWLKKEDDGKPFFRLIILKRKNSKVKKVYRVHYYEYSTTAKMVAEIYGWENYLQMTFQKTLKESKPVLDLFFKKCDYAVVQEHTWNLMQELNPQLTQKLEIVHKSKRIFVDLISLFSNRLSQKDKDAYFRVIGAINTTAAGKQLMRLFKFNGLIRIDNEQFSPLENYYQEYIQLREKHVH